MDLEGALFDFGRGLEGGREGWLLDLEWVVFCIGIGTEITKKGTGDAFYCTLRYILFDYVWFRLHNYEKSRIFAR